MKLIKFIIIVAIMVALPFTVKIIGSKAKPDKQNQTISYKQSDSYTESIKGAGNEY